MSLVPDPYFNDASKWTSTGTGSAVVADGLLTCTAFIGSVDPVGMAPMVPGANYTYALDIRAAGIDAYITFGGRVIWVSAFGTGVFTGTFTPYNEFDLQIAQDESATLVINRAYINDMHLRQQIREAAASIVGNLSTTSTRVFQSRVYNVQESELPCLLIMTNDEAVDIENSLLEAPARLLQLTVEGKAQATSDLDDTLDDVAEEVEVAMAADITMGGLTENVYLDGTSIQLTGEGDQPIGSVILNYIVSYRTPFGDPSTVG